MGYFKEQDIESTEKDIEIEVEQIRHKIKESNCSRNTQRSLNRLFEIKEELEIQGENTEFIFKF